MAKHIHGIGKTDFAKLPLLNSCTNIMGRRKFIKNTWFHGSLILIEKKINIQNGVDM